MLLSDDKKKLSTLIVSKMGKTSEAPTVDGAEQDDSMPLEAAAEELMSAIKADSAKGVVEALKSLIEMLDSDPEETPVQE